VSDPDQHDKLAAARHRGEVRASSFSAIGGATIPLPAIMGVIVSTPLAVLEMSETGALIRLRWRWMSSLIEWFMTRFGAVKGTPAEWRASWGSIERALIGPRSLVLFRGSGYPCRFAVSKRAVAREIEATLVEHGVAVERVRTTARYAYYATQPRPK
jgi:hypothetical protein